MNNIAFLGGGNIATAIIGGLLNTGYAGTDISVADPDQKQCRKLSQMGVSIASTNSQAAQNADVILICVKPDQVEIAATAIVPLRPDQLVISVAAGINTTSLKQWLGSANLVRCMPNTPALVETGATGLHANEYVNDEQHDLAENIMRSVGITVWVQDEDELNAVTAISGSGPAYFFLLMEAMEASAKSLGLSDDVARILIEQTALGAAKIALESGESPSELRQRVTSPNGTTEQALNTFANGDFNGLVERALKSAHDRSISLSEELGA